MKSIWLFCTCLFLLSCGDEDSVELVCIANPLGTINTNLVNLTAIRGSTSLLSNTETNGNNNSEGDQAYAIENIVFALNGDSKASSTEGSQGFSAWTQFEPLKGAPTISCTIDGKAFSIDPEDSLVLWENEPFSPGLYIYYIVVEDLSQDKVSIVIQEWENYSEECNDTFDTSG